LPLTLPACTTVQMKMTVLIPISVGTTSGRPPGSAPATVVARRPRRTPRPTQSTHW
jgi:hypothetical protein